MSGFPQNSVNIRVFCLQQMIKGLFLGKEFAFRPLSRPIPIGGKPTDRRVRVYRPEKWDVQGYEQIHPSLLAGCPKLILELQFALDREFY